MSADVVEVYAIASHVLIDGDVSARVTEIRIVEGRVIYGVVWWAQGARNEQLLDAWEIKPDGDKARMTRVTPIL